MSSRHRALDQFGQNVRKQRAEKGLSQEALADKADLDSTYISGIERGVRNPSLLSIVRIAKALGTDSGSLFQGVKA
ncbi:helix-turn-helix transcriptional regulator [Prosthecobacter sp.]|uniref:helix-turn-helix domain-containing protein n=1 Tax=Prosthecobacter sp. TaxID=1965333 RepID=UPI001D4FB798|nr:helix-turn-helix transcriptional regulator [Prosthecobacter sp.]MCB1276165.1 helix-turn-helix transcriptional regulator [Prosthecobacter sp.]